MSTGAASLPPAAFATGSAVVNMLRQVGLAVVAVGVAVLVAVVGSPHSPDAARTAFREGWTVIAATSFVAAVLGATLLRKRNPAALAAASQPTPAPTGNLTA